MKTISYAITLNDEWDEFNNLINVLKDNIRECDEIVVLCDNTNEFDQFIEGTWMYNKEFTGDFSEHKNYLNRRCTKDYIFQIDADELITPFFIDTLPHILELNTVDLFYVPRRNAVEGITDEYIKKWGWNVNEDGYINYPDVQSRIYLNTETIYWTGKVHEKITGFKSFAYLSDDLYLLHHKTIEKQIKQNSFYDRLVGNSN